MRIHLREIHQEELGTDLPLKVKGFDIELPGKFYNRYHDA